MNWTLADIAALHHQAWPARQCGDAALAKWLRIQMRLARIRHDDLVRSRRFSAARARIRADVMLAVLPAEPEADVAYRRAILAGYEPQDEAPHLVHGVWRWSAA